MVASKSRANELTGQIINFLLKEGCYAWRAQSSGLYDPRIGSFRSGPKRGVSDILGLIGGSGRLLAIEVKIGADRLSDEQIGFGKNIEHCGGLWYVAQNFEDFKLWWCKTLSIDNNI